MLTEGRDCGWWCKESITRKVSTAPGGLRAGRQALPGREPPQQPPFGLHLPCKYHVKNQGPGYSSSWACISTQVCTDLPRSPEAEPRPKRCQTTAPSRVSPTPSAAPVAAAFASPSSLSGLTLGLGITLSYHFMPVLLIPKPTFTQFQRGLGKAAHRLSFLPREELSWFLGSREGLNPQLRPRLLLFLQPAPSLHPIL